VIILAHVHNRLFLEKCVDILQDTMCTIVTFQSLSALATYGQLSKTLLILEKSDKVIVPGALFLSPIDTPSNFSKKVKIFLESLRK